MSNPSDTSAEGQNIVCVILTEAGAAVGLGHLTRCVALYDAFEACGVSCELVVAGEAPEHVVESRGVLLDDWRSSEAAALITKDADIAVIDSYHADLSTYRTVSETVAVPVYLDDTARIHYPRGFTVNGNPAAEKLSFARQSDSCYLLGSRYQLLRPEFAGLDQRAIREEVARVMIVSGGSDAAGMLSAVGAAVAAASPNIVLDVVDSPRTAAEMREAMLSADIAVTAAGQTLYELAATGTPAIAICVADNQVAQAKAFEEAGAITLAGTWGESDFLGRVQSSLRTLSPAAPRRAMSAAARNLVDGLGASRVASVCVDAALRSRQTSGRT